MTLVRYSLGMAGNGVEDGAGAQDADWAREGRRVLQALVDRAIVAISETTVEAGDLVAADRIARTVVNVARAIKTVESLRPLNSGTATTPEDEMGDSREYTPDEEVAMRDELFRRTENLRDIIERKRAARCAEGAGAGEATAGDAAGGGSPVAGGLALADLGDAGGTGGGQDLRRSPLAA